MFLKKFSVKNFKNFKNTFTIDFSDVKDYHYSTQCISQGLIKNAIIYGKNAVGKTNFGLAIADITYHLVDKNGIAKSIINYCNADADSDVVSFSYVFQREHDEITYKYSKKTAKELVLEELWLNDRLVFSFDYIKQTGDFSHLKEYQLDTLNWEFRDSGISVLRYMANKLPLDGKNPVKEVMKFVSGMLWFRSLGNNNEFVGFSTVTESMVDYIIKNGFVHEFEEFLNTYGVHEQICAASQADGKKSLFFKHTRLVPFFEASNGTCALLTFFYWYKQSEHISFLFIDEFDAFYHYELAEKIVKLLEEKFPIQTILTSHNTGLLSNRIMRPDCYFLLIPDKIISLANATDRELREGYNLENLMKHGEFDE
ncbi:AAA family ATPase [Megasphaera sp.]|uniref:AAA family ATPase n=1 Tax=Megasphaera sp. TaxID=2023260 RepID=UPI003F7EAF26